MLAGPYESIAVVFGCFVIGRCKDWFLSKFEMCIYFHMKYLVMYFDCIYTTLLELLNCKH